MDENRLTIYATSLDYPVNKLVTNPWSARKTVEIYEEYQLQVYVRCLYEAWIACGFVLDILSDLYHTVTVIVLSM